MIANLVYISSHRVDLSYLFLQSHNLEALKVGQVLSSLNLSILLGPAAGGELAVDFLFLPELADGASAGGARKLGDDKGSESSVGQGEGVARDNLLFLSGRTVDEHLYHRR
jgi:hypothetical protein